MNKNTFKSLFIVSTLLYIFSSTYTAQLQDRAKPYAMDIGGLVGGALAFKLFLTPQATVPACVGLALWSNGLRLSTLGSHRDMFGQTQQAQTTTINIGNINRVNTNHLLTAPQTPTTPSAFNPGFWSKAGGLTCMGIGATFVVNNTKWNIWNSCKTIFYGGIILTSTEGIRSFITRTPFKKSNVIAPAAVTLLTPLVWNNTDTIFSLLPKSTEVVKA